LSLTFRIFYRHERYLRGLKLLLYKIKDVKENNGIMLLEAAYKVIAILIHERLQPVVSTLDHESQCGLLRPDRNKMQSSL